MLVIYSRHHLPEAVYVGGIIRIYSGKEHWRERLIQLEDVWGGGHTQDSKLPRS